MTDEEKANEYATEQMKSYLTLDDYSYGVLKLKITEAYLDGLAEGRKEQIEKEFHKHNLYVENKRLKQSVRELVEKKTELEKETFKLQGEKQKLKQEIEDWKDRDNWKQRAIDTYGDC